MKKLIIFFYLFRLILFIFVIHRQWILYRLPSFQYSFFEYEIICWFLSFSFSFQILWHGSNIINNIMYLLLIWDIFYIVCRILWWETHGCACSPYVSWSKLHSWISACNVNRVWFGWGAFFVRVVLVREVIDRLCYICNRWWACGSWWYACTEQLSA